MNIAQTNLTHENKQETAAYKEILPLIQPKETDKNIPKLISDLQLKWKDYFTITDDQALNIRYSSQAKSTITESKMYQLIDTYLNLFIFLLDKLCRLGENTLRDIVNDISNRAHALKMQDIDQFSLDFTQCGQLKENNLKQLGADIISHFQKLHKLSLNFSQCQGLSNDIGEVDHLVAELSQNLKYLQQLSLSFSRCPIKDETAAKIGTHIAQHWKTLVQLTLDFKDCGTITEKTAIHLVSQISEKLENLWRLTLDFGNNKLSEGGFEKTCFSIAKNLSKLEQLSLGFAGSEWMDDGQFLRGLTEIAQNLPDLKELSLNLFDCSGITEVGIKDLDAIFLEHFDHLQQLSLNFGKNTKISEQAAIQLTFNIVHNLKELQQLELGFRELLTPDSAIKIFSDISQYHPNLRVLSLDFAHCGISDDTLREISKNLGQNLKGLQKLSLNLGRNWITAQGAKCFSADLAKNKKGLQHLSLDFTGCEEVSGDFGTWAREALPFIHNLDIKH